VSGTSWTLGLNTLNNDWTGVTKLFYTCKSCWWKTWLLKLLFDYIRMSWNILYYTILGYPLELLSYFLISLRIGDYVSVFHVLFPLVF